MLYTMIVEQDFFGTFLGTFPDMPGCAAEAESMDELMENASAAAYAWAAEQGLTILPEAEDREPDFSDPRRSPMLVEIAREVPELPASEVEGEESNTAPAEGNTAPAEAPEQA